MLMAVSWDTEPGLIFPGHEATAGTRCPPPFPEASLVAVQIAVGTVFGRAVIGEEENQRVFSNSLLFESGDYFADALVHFGHHFPVCLFDVLAFVPLDAPLADASDRFVVRSLIGRMHCFMGYVKTERIVFVLFDEVDGVFGDEVRAVSNFGFELQAVPPVCDTHPVAMGDEADVSAHIAAELVEFVMDGIKLLLVPQMPFPEDSRLVTCVGKQF